MCGTHEYVFVHIRLVVPARLHCWFQYMGGEGLDSPDLVQHRTDFSERALIELQMMMKFQTP